MAPARLNETRPAVALLHPLWVGALIVLVVNDHALKGTGLLPAAVTGKLSDVAGLVVAPMLLATVLRTAGRRALIACHGLVGAVFAAIQLWDPAANAWAGLMSAVGFPWQIAPDPTDLLALPALAASWHILVPVASSGGARRPAVRTLRASMAGLGLLACLGTSPPEQPELFADFFGELYLHNNTTDDRVVRVRPLRDDVLVDCQVVDQEPGHLLQAELFGAAQTWSIPPTANVPVRTTNFDEEPGLRACHAAFVESDETAPRVVFWPAGDPPERFIEGNTFDQKDHERGAIIIQREDGELVYDDLDEGLVFAPVTDSEPSNPVCTFPADADRLEWSTPVPLGTFELVAVDFGADGCIELELPAQRRWYLCVPAELFSFAPGDTVEISDLPTTGTAIAGTWDAVAVRRLDPGTGQPTADEAELWAIRGSGLPVMWGTGAMFTSACPSVTEPVCATAGRNGDMSLLVGTNVVTLSAGTTALGVAAPDGAELDFALMHAQERVVLDPACALGPDQLGLDLELAAARAVP